MRCRSDRTLCDEQKKFFESIKAVTALNCGCSEAIFVQQFPERGKTESFFCFVMSNKMPLSRARIWSAWTVLVLFYAYQYILRVIPNILLPYMQQKFGVDGVIFGQFSGVYYTGYAFAHIPFGILIAKYGLKKIIPWAIILAAAGVWPIIYSDYWGYPLIGRALTGIGSSCSIIAVFHFLTITFPRERFTKLLSIVVSLGLVAAIYAGAPTAYLVQYFGYQPVVNALILVGVILSIFAYIIFREETEECSIGLKKLWTILTNPKIVMTALASGLMVGALEGFPDAWGASFLSMKYHLSTPKAAQLTSYIFFGMLVGCPLCSWLASYKQRYFQTLIALGCIMAGGFALLLLSSIHMSYIFLSVLFFLIGICCSYQVPAIYVGSSFFDTNLASLVSTTINMIVMVFGHIIHTFIGGAINAFGGLGSLLALKKALLVIPTTCVIGVMILTFLWKKVAKKV